MGDLLKTIHANLFAITEFRRRRSRLITTVDRQSGGGKNRRNTRRRVGMSRKACGAGGTFN